MFGADMSPMFFGDMNLTFLAHGGTVAASLITSCLFVSRSSLSIYDDDNGLITIFIDQTIAIATARALGASPTSLDLLLACAMATLYSIIGTLAILHMTTRHSVITITMIIIGTLIILNMTTRISEGSGNITSPSSSSSSAP